MSTNQLNDKVLRFLHKWINEGKVANVRKGMVEDLQNFVTSILADQEASRAAARMQQSMEQSTEEAQSNEENS